MRFPINRDYTDEQRLAACEAIFNAPNGEWKAPCERYWPIFVGGPWDPLWLDTAKSYLLLRQLAFEWFTNYRIEALISDIAHIKPNRLGPRHDISNPHDHLT